MAGVNTIALKRRAFCGTLMVGKFGRRRAARPEKEGTVMAKLTMDKLVALCKNRGYIFAGSEIYGGLANTWDYGPLGVEFKNNVKRA